ncbi:MAG: OmpW family outer membrane protein [Bacteroidota bacterium]
MKKFFLLVFALLMFGTTSAQEFKPIQFHIGLGVVGAAEGKGGLLFGIEPSYRINDRVALGGQLQWGFMGKELEKEDTEASTVGSYTVNGKYYLSDNAFRPFVGLGLGLYSMGNVKIENSQAGESVSLGNEFGFYPRIGVEFWHLNLTVDLNIVGKTDAVAINNAGVQTKEDEINNSYISFRLGFFLGGGRR